MRKIIEVNDKACYALLEPGVTFFDLFNYCKEKKLKVYPSVPSLGWGSIVGNTIDRGWGYTPLGEHCAAQCGLEVSWFSLPVLKFPELTPSVRLFCHRAK